MFGFREKAKLRKICENLKGATLSEVVEKFANRELLELDWMPFNMEIVRSLSKEITDDDKSDGDALAKKLETLCANFSFHRDSISMYLAWTKFDQLRMYAIQLPAASILMRSQDEFVEYFFNDFLKSIPVSNLVPILFPPKRLTSIEDFLIKKDIRSALIDGLFSRLKSRSQLNSLIDSFVRENPYYNCYPF